MAYKTWSVMKAGDKYNDSDGKEKTRFEPVGTLLFNDEKNRFSLKLFITGEWYTVFENVPRDQKAKW